MEKSEFILLSKLQMPKIYSRLLYRERLLNLLFQNRHKKLIVLWAGAGYGKTTLITQFVHEAKIACVYYQLRREDADPAIFLHHLNAGIQHLYPRFGNNIAQLRQFFNLPPPMADIVLGTFVNEMIQNIDHDTLFIFDDYHALEETTAIENVLSYLLNNMPSKLHIVLISRHRLAFPFLAQLKSKDEFFEITPEHFRFSREEIGALFLTLFNWKLNSQEIEWLYEYSEGWPACLRLIAQAYELNPGLEPQVFLNRLRTDYQKISQDIFEYFSREIFKNELPEIQQFLITCSLLDCLNPEICRVITGRIDASVLLEDLARRNAFIQPLPNGSYRFHSLFREFLKSQFRDERRKREIYRLVGLYNEKRNGEESLKYYLLAGDYPAALRMIEFLGTQLIQHGKYSTLLSALKKIPERFFKGNPLILKHYGVALNCLGDPTNAREILKRALRIKGSSAEITAELLYTYAGVLINEGHLAKAIQGLKRLIKICPQRLPLLKASALNSLGAIYNARGGKNLFQAKRLFKRAFEIVERHGFQELKASVLNNWAMNEFKSGNLVDAYEKIIPATNLLRDFFSPGCGAAFYNGARIALLLGDKTSAERILGEGINIGTLFNDSWSLASVYRGYGLWYMDNGNLEKAREFFKKALTSYEQTKVPWLIITTLIEICKIEIMEKNFLEAEKILKRIKELKKDSVVESVAIAITEAELKIGQERYQEAEGILRSAERLCQRWYLCLENFFIHLQLCRLFYRQERFNLAIKYLKNLVKTAMQHNYGYLLIQELKREPGLSALMIKNCIHPDYIFALLKKYQIFHILEVSFFGEPTLVVDRKKVLDHDWCTTKTKKLFFYLILNRNKEIFQEELIETFWPKAGWKQGYASLRKAVSHIRQTLQKYGIKEPIIVQAGQYKLSPELYIIADVDEFERLIKNFNEGRSSNSENKRLLSIYKNGFARSWYDDWVIARGDRYRGMMEKISYQFAASKRIKGLHDYDFSATSSWE
ncbi:MAG: AAA family ATPase [candidate division WOR-3 bacterium]